VTLLGKNGELLKYVVSEVEWIPYMNQALVYFDCDPPKTESSEAPHG
jgi:hypothetical protein